MKKKKIFTEKAPQPVGPYSQAIRVEDLSSLIFISGQVAIDPASGKSIKGNIKEQTRRTIENIKSILEKNDASLENVVKVTVYLTDMEDFEEMNKVYNEYFEDSRPARAAVEISNLAKEFKVEIEAIACL